ncbi:glycosyl hydrolase 2 galactose-binding domain-containing protein [Streptomyces sp. NPDC054956]
MLHHRPARTRLRARLRPRLRVLAVIGLLCALTALAPVPAAPQSAPPPGPASGVRVTAVAADPGSATPLSDYSVQSTARVSDTAAAVSTPGYAAKDWYRAGPRATVLAALLAHGTYRDPFYSTNQQAVPPAEFTVPWWFRSEFSLVDTGARTYLDFSGVISAADVFVNGRQIATAAEVAGAYTHHELDITSLVRAGANSVAFRIRPNNPLMHLTAGWLDWLQPPPDANMGTP